MSTTTSTTPETITDTQICALSTESAEAGDLAQVAICQRALGELDPWDDTPQCDRIADRAAVEAALTMSIAAARAECARVIADAQAMADGE